MSQPARHLRPTVAPIEPVAPGPHLRVVRRAERTAAARRRRARALLVIGVGALVAVMFALVYLHVVMAQRQIELDRLSTQVTAETTRYQDLRLQVAELESPQQIISVAEGRLGMRQPGSVVYVSPPPGSSPVDRGASTAAPVGEADWPAVKAALAGRP